MRRLDRVWQAEAEVRWEARGEMVRGATARATGRGERGCGRAHIGISSDESADSSSSLSRTSTCAWCLAPSSVCRRSSAISVICCRLRSATSASPVRFRDIGIAARSAGTCATRARELRVNAAFAFVDP